MSNRRFRIIIRWLHIAGSGFFGAYLYSPTLATHSVFYAIVAYVIFPLMALSGIALWQQPKLMKLIKGSRKRNTSQTS
ncbi:MAG: hypothetical protein AAF787_00865 [Chloroflexota bacterium]